MQGIRLWFGDFRPCETASLYDKPFSSKDLAIVCPYFGVMLQLRCLPCSQRKTFSGGRFGAGIALDWSSKRTTSKGKTVR
jgi:hypothetical protein